MKTIQKLFLVIVALFAFQPSFAGDPIWAELQTFHSVMAKTFHPAEEGNLAPLKANAADLLAKAKAWKAAAVPAGFKKEETAKVLTELVAKCEEINKAVTAKADDKKLTALITEAHDVFHQIAEKCRAGDEGHGHEHGHEGHKH
ncbi:MAG TPA: hypothetical protein PKY12_02345 [Catalimonadaceae bacterium]|jgi:hypothetical protein|nr:hypothetical protein [Catalimonadaceae bacterium]